MTQEEINRLILKADHLDIAKARIVELESEVEHLADMSSCDLCKSGLCSAHQPYTGQIERLQKDVVHWHQARKDALAAGDIMVEQLRKLREQVAEARLMVLEALSCEPLADHAANRMRKALIILDKYV